MSVRKIISACAIVLAFAALTAYQNCAQNFTPFSGSDASLSSLNHDLPHIFSNSPKMAANVNLEFQVHASSLSSQASYLWSYHFNGVLGAGCSALSQSTSIKFILLCPSAGDLVVSAQVFDAGQIISVSDLQTPLTFGGATDSLLNIHFTIAKGTGSNPWNEMSAPIEVFVGQTLSVLNGDSVPHQLHTNGSPCPHGNTFAPGASFDCVIASSYDSATNGAIYDHGAGTSARFYVIAYDGAKLYTTNCANCHGPLASSKHRNATAGQIQASISNVGAMRSPQLTSLTTVQIQAIAYALSK